jgi:hypothetical protein
MNTPPPSADKPSVFGASDDLIICTAWRMYAVEQFSLSEGRSQMAVQLDVQGHVNHDLTKETFTQISIDIEGARQMLLTLARALDALEAHQKAKQS